ncbi:MAG: hypothetical protein OEZ34_00835 [Spirochaetia bacterium]|nr:hypothetical protein [Spirochaetia bacterium]
MSQEKVISMPIKDLSDLKVILATWYTFLREQMDSIEKDDFTRYLKTPVVYNLEKDNIEILFTGTEDLLKKFSDYVIKS